MFRKVLTFSAKTRNLCRISNTRRLISFTPKVVRKVPVNTLAHVFVKRFYASVPNTKLSLPSLSPTMEKGKIVKWLKKEGDRIEVGQLIAEIETDKATIPWESTEEGYLAKILVQPGKEVVVGDTIGVLVEKNEQVAEYARSGGSDEIKPKNAAPATPTPSTPPPEPKKSSAPPAGPAPPTLSMPALSPTMEAGTIVKWLIKEGGKIAAGDNIAEIETDKSTVAFESTEDGFLAKILVQSGGKVAVGDPIAVVVSSEADIPKWKDYSADASSTAPAAPTPSTPTPSTPTSAPPTTQPTPSVTKSTGGRVIASPLAKANAAKLGFDLSTIQGTGPNGRIIAADVSEHVPKQKEKQPTTTTTPQPPSIADFIDIPNSNIRQITADRLTFSKQNIPHYYLTVDINVDKLLELRTTLNNLAGKDTKFKLSINDFVLKAAALALRAVPEVNSEWRGDHIRRYNSVHINVAVNTPKGLLTPIVRDTDKLGLKAINNAVTEIAERANEGKSTLNDMRMGTFTVSNLGKFGISNFSAVINPPQAAILAVGGTRKVVALDEASAEPKLKHLNMMTVTLSCDHRVVDGAIGAQWLQVFKDLMENPIKFIL